MIQRSRRGAVRRMLLSLLATSTCAVGLLAGGLFAPGAQAATAGTLSMLPESPVPLTSVTVDPSSNLIYAQQNAGTRFFSYDPETEAWAELAASPLNSGNNGGAAFLNGKVYTSYTSNRTQLGVYDVASNTWSIIANPLGEGTTDIAAAGEDLYMVDGTSFVSYNPETEAVTTLAEAPKFDNGDCAGEGFEQWGGLGFYEGKLYGHQGNGCNGFAVYDIASDSWSELPMLPAPQNGAVAGGAIDPAVGAYFAYGNYDERFLFRYSIATERWDTIEVPFTVNDGGMAYVSLPGAEGIYAIQGEEGNQFARYLAEPEADLSLGIAATVAGKTSTAAEVLYTITVTNGGGNEAVGVKLTDNVPSNVSLLSVHASQGSCSGTTTLSCSLGDLAFKATATVTVKVLAGEGAAMSAAAAESETFDPNTANNSATLVPVVAVNTVTKTVTVTTPPSTSLPPAIAHCVVPKLHGLTLKQARKALKGAHCKLGQVVHHFNKTVRSGRVIYSNPHNGITLTAQHRIQLVISRGRLHPVHAKQHQRKHVNAHQPATTPKRPGKAG